MSVCAKCEQEFDLDEDGGVAAVLRDASGAVVGEIAVCWATEDCYENWQTYFDDACAAYKATHGGEQ